MGRGQRERVMNAHSERQEGKSVSHVTRGGTEQKKGSPWERETASASAADRLYRTLGQHLVSLSNDGAQCVNTSMHYGERDRNTGKDNRGVRLSKATTNSATMRMIFA